MIRPVYKFLLSVSILFILLSSPISFAQDKNDFIGTWKETERLVIGINAHNSGNKLIIYENGNYKSRTFDGFLTQTYNDGIGTWEITEDNKLELLHGPFNRSPDYEEEWDIFELKGNILILESMGGYEKKSKKNVEYTAEKLKMDIRYKKSE